MPIAEWHKTHRRVRVESAELVLQQHCTFLLGDQLHLTHKSTTVPAYRHTQHTENLLLACRSAGKIGFLKTKNRVNVLLSRARHGMYILGNAEALQAEARFSDDMWPQVRPLSITFQPFISPCLMR